ncbi:MAG: hypothetical protein H7832_07035 [Magnetococcus sp. DMHC-6]
MADRDQYSSEQLEKIRATLRQNLGQESSQALDNLNNRFVPSEKSEATLQAVKKKKSQEEEKQVVQVDVHAIIQEGDLKKLLDSLELVKDDGTSVRMVVAALLKHPLIKAFHMVEAMSKVSDKRELVEALATGMVIRKGVNPLIDALRYAVISPDAIKNLATGIAEQGTVNHIIRAIATAPRGLAEAEIIWAMEVMGKGTIEQMMEAMNLLEKDSPGVVILATGIVNRAEVTVEPLVRGLGLCKENPKAAAILAIELTRLADLTSLIMILEKHVTDATEAGEYLIVKLVQRSLDPACKQKVLSRACKSIVTPSIAGQILAMGIVEQGDPLQLERSYSRFPYNPAAKKIIGLGIFQKNGKIQSFRIMGKEVLDIIKSQGEIENSIKEARKRYHWVLQNVLGEDIRTEQKRSSAKEEIINQLNKDPVPAPSAAVKKSK